MKNSIKIIFGFLLIFTFCVSNAFAAKCSNCNKMQQGENFSFEKREQMTGKCMEELNITAEQKTKLEELRKNYGEKIKPLRTQIKDKRTAIKTELSKENYDTSMIENLKKEIKELAAASESERTDLAIEMRKILTAEQFEKLEARKNKNENKKMQQKTDQFEKMKK